MGLGNQISDNLQTVWQRRPQFRSAAAALIVFAAILAAPDGATAQDGFSTGDDNGDAPVTVPGFGNPAPEPLRDRPELGAEGTGDYAAFLGRFSVLQPSEDLAGVWSVMGVTLRLCGALYRGEGNLLQVAPKGFKIERSDIYVLGFAGKVWNEDAYAITITGDSEKDAAAGHPGWEVEFREDGSLRSCGVMLGSPTIDRQSSATEDSRKNAAFFMVTAFPQIYSGIVTEPHYNGAFRVDLFGLHEMLTPCGGTWCKTTTIYDFRDGNWQFSSRTSFSRQSQSR
ncbi:hypothetical protein ABVF61_13710 [Roseibium sp. HPY-6]|uniref:hypothetical protein n=1 Tax=Roseibium sp. HPY-6 TaxID=3229852 RepID=UPI00338E3E52